MKFDCSMSTIEEGFFLDSPQRHSVMWLRFSYSSPLAETNVIPPRSQRMIRSALRERRPVRGEREGQRSPHLIRQIGISTYPLTRSAKSYARTSSNGSKARYRTP